MPQGDMATMGHRHVLCDGCQRHEFPGRRYRCLRCRNYDLCGDCYDQCVQTEHHLMDHPMQLILLEPQSVPELASDSDAVEQLHMSNCYTCPYCKVMGYTAKGLIQHVYGLHSEDDSYVVCPMCACAPAANLRTMQNLSRHLLTNHIDYANFLEPNTPPLPALPPEAATSSRRLRRRNHTRLLQQQQQQQQEDAAYAQLVNTGQFATDDTFLDLSNVQISNDLLNNLRSLYSDEEIANMTGSSASTLNPTGRTSSPPSTPITPVVPHPEKPKKERRPKADRCLLTKWMAGQQKQWKISSKASKSREKQALFTEQILLSMMCDKHLELPEIEPIDDTLELKLSETESIETIEPNQSETEEPLKTGKVLEPMLAEKDLTRLKTEKVLEPKISQVMSLMAIPWTQAFMASQTNDCNSSAIKQFIHLIGATTDETQVDEINQEPLD
ncbi:uncharacterized protein ZK652.6-like [Drosophila pseudoobscura]|uniref:E3 ubiquitin-protein ligase KCMF1 n=1 Tax=Drosophila pseudoobscura pseudoobscura TaxID=46245 RepID=A0A6I8ULE2_DROPS|nr:uncharacterized protein ZK652.6 [Drosophila pseudoobscura]